MPHPIDTYRDAFLRLMADGMSYREALETFDEDEFTKAALAEMDARGSLIMNENLDLVTNDERRAPALFDLLVHANFEKKNSVDGHDYKQALDLWQAGWTSECANPPSEGFWGQTQVMSWYWRRPPRRKGKRGRLYLSTNQAWNALQKETGQA